MASSKVAVANLALSKVGALRISSFTEDKEEARVINNVYNDILDEVLSEHQWTFAQKRTTLATLSTSPAWDDDNLTIIYAIPSDFIKLNYVNSADAIVKIENEGIFSNEANLAILYTFRNDNPSTYSPQFTSALATRLAAEIAFTLSESVSKAQALREDYEGIRLPRAIAIDSQQGSPMSARADEWERARFTGSGDYVKSSGDVWIPA